MSLLDRRAQHIVKVLKCKVGDTIRVGEIDGRQGVGVVLQLETSKPFGAMLEVEFNDHSEALPEIDLILALPRPIMLRRILSQLAALGVGMIYLINSNRVEKSFWQATILQEREYREHFLHGLEQAVATRVPKIQIHQRFRPFIEDYLPAQLSQYQYRFLAHPEKVGAETSNLTQPGRLIVAIGPEGGWVDFEVQKFAELGFSGLSLGTRILKVDTAVIAAHARLSLLREFAKQQR